MNPHETYAPPEVYAALKQAVDAANRLNSPPYSVRRDSRRYRKWKHKWASKFQRHLNRASRYLARRGAPDDKGSEEGVAWPIV